MVWVVLIKEFAPKVIKDSARRQIIKRIQNTDKAEFTFGKLRFSLSLTDVIMNYTESIGE